MLLFLILSSIITSFILCSNPYETGPYLSSLIDINYGNHSTYGSGVSVHIFIVTPKNADITLPVYYFFTAFAGKVPAPMYRNYFNHIASHGYVVVGLDNKDAQVKPNFQVELASTVSQAIEWLQDGNLVNLFNENGVTTVPDFTKNMLGGHSAGGHTVTQLIKTGCTSITSLVLVDPVDGLSPWELFKKVSEFSSVIHPPAKVTFEIPLLHLDNLMDPLSPFPEKPQYPACAPEPLSNDRFYDAWRGPAWQINATYFGHMDIVNGGEINELNKIFDLFCVGNTTSSNAEYIKLTAGATVAFNKMLYSGDDSYRVYLEDASTMPTEVILNHNYHGYTAPFQPFCTNN